MKPLVRGEREFLWTAGGTRYIDAISGVYNTSYGHAHPHIMEAIREASESGILNCYDNPYLSRRLLEDELCALTGFNEIHLFSSGAETVEKALMLALRSLPEKRRGVLHFKRGFHGKTMGTYGLFDSEAGELPYHHCVGDAPDVSHGPGAERQQLDAMRHMLEGDHGVVILEPVMGYYGYIFSYSFLEEVKKVCDETDSILVFDEMITSFGRAGVNFMSDRVKPDILVVGKGLGQGLPIMAVLFDKDGKVQADGFSWTTATANGPFLCQIGLASCQVLVQEKMAEKSWIVGSYLRDMLALYPNIYEHCDVRGIGSMVFVKLEESIDAHSVEVRLRNEQHVLTRAHGSTLVMMPPFITLRGSCREIAYALHKVLEK